MRNGFLHYRTGNHLYPDWAEKGKRKVMIFFNRRIHTTFLWNADTSSEAKDFGKLFISHISPYFSQRFSLFVAVTLGALGAALWVISLFTSGQYQIPSTWLTDESDQFLPKSRYLFCKS